MPLTLAIIGTAGRKDDAAKLTLAKWNVMKHLIARFVKEHEVKDVVSGGAAWADHMAVGLYNADLVDNLTLALPCEFDWQRGEFVDTGVFDWRTNPGAVSNQYHRQFSKVIGQGSLDQIKRAIYKGAKVEIEGGFMARNSIVAKADMVIALTFGDGPVVKDGGTADTCRKYLANGGNSLFHVDLHHMSLHSAGIV